MAAVSCIAGLGVALPAKISARRSGENLATRVNEGFFH